MQTNTSNTLQRTKALFFAVVAIDENNGCIHSFNSFLKLVLQSVKNLCPQTIDRQLHTFFQLGCDIICIRYVLKLDKDELTPPLDHLT
jgi:hypothetical protein